MRTTRRFVTPALLIFAAAAAFFAGLHFARGRHVKIVPSTDRLVVTVLNVGQGEAAIVQDPSGHFDLVGTGPHGQTGRLVATLHAAGAKSIDTLFLPYPYEEAIGSAADLIANFPVKSVVESGGPEIKSLNRWEEQLRTVCTQKAIPIRAGRAGDTIPMGTAKWTVLAPGPVRVEAAPTSPNNSLVLKLQYGQTTFLWAGGLDRAGEQALLARTANLSANWLRVARCGTENATSSEFLQRVLPDDAVISVAANATGYPSQDTLTRLQAAGATIYRTDAAANGLSFFSDGVRIYSPPVP